MHANVHNKTPDQYIDEMWRFVDYHRSFYMKNMEYIKAWNCYQQLIRTSNSLECRNFVNNRRFGAHPQWFVWCLKLMEMFANSYNDYVLWDKTGITHRRGKKEVFKNQRLKQLWSVMDAKIVRKELNDGKIVFDTSNVTDEDILSFLNEASKALKVDSDTLAQMCDKFDKENDI